MCCFLIFCSFFFFYYKQTSTEICLTLTRTHIATRHTKSFAQENINEIQLYLSLFHFFHFFFFFFFFNGLSAGREDFSFSFFLFFPAKENSKEREKVFAHRRKNRDYQNRREDYFFFFLFFFVCVAAILVAISSQFDFVYVHGVEKTELEEISISSIERPSNSFG